MSYRKIGREARQRHSVFAGQAVAVILNEGIVTTEAKAKEVRKFVDKLITYGKRGTLVSRRKALAFVYNNKECVDKVFNELAKRYEARNGGYTRIIKLKERIGDDALEVRLELV